MKLGLLFLLLACGCSSNSSSGNVSPVGDAGGADVESSNSKELVCADNFCGVITDKKTKATADCGSCSGNTQCGDNGIAHICGSACLPLTASDGDGGIYNITPACDYYLGTNWGNQYGTQLQFAGSCNYMDPNNCLPIYVQEEPNKPCGGTVCGNWFCCVASLDAGVSPTLPGAVATDGDLP